MIAGNKLEQEVIRVIIADDQLIIRQTLQLQLASETKIRVIACVDNGMAALAKIAEFLPDIIIIDLEMPGMDGITAIKQISDRFPQTKALVFSSHDEREYIDKAIIAGAKGYLLKGTSPENLVTTIFNIYQGYFQLGSGLLDKISFSTTKTSLTSVDLLSKSNLNLQEPKLMTQITKIVKHQLTKQYNILNNSVNEKLQLISAENAAIYSKFKIIELKFYLLLTIQMITIVFLLFKRS